MPASRIETISLTVSTKEDVDLFHSLSRLLPLIVPYGPTHECPEVASGPLTIMSGRDSGNRSVIRITNVLICPLLRTITS